MKQFVNMGKPLGKLARRIVIEIDERGMQKIESTDFMVATGTNPQNMVMLDLPEPRPTDSRLVAMALVNCVSMYLQAIFLAMGGGADGKKN